MALTKPFRPKRPKDVKDLAVRAWKDRDGTLALSVCEQIAEQDLYINAHKPEPTGRGCYKVIRYGTRPCQSGSGLMVHDGEVAWWEPNIGAFKISWGPIGTINYATDEERDDPVRYAHWFAQHPRNPE